MSKILITGGHLTPALAFIDYLKTTHPKEEIIFAGREYAQIANGQTAWERSEIEKRGLPFIPFQAQKSGNFNLFTYADTVRQAKTILTENQIDLVLSFGGFMALPFALAAKKLKIPVITHEQTRVLGRANRALTLLADTTAVSYEDTLLPFWARHIQVTGNPLRAQLWQSAPVPDWFHPTSQLPILLVCGGSQGSQAINELLLPILTPLSQDFIIVHQVGKASDARNPLAEINAYISQNYTTLSNYFPREFLTLEELAFFYQNATLAVTRAGANTVAELTAFRMPTLFIPLPNANYDEQYQNAAALTNIDAAVVIRQEELRPSDLLGEINQLASQAETIRQNLTNISTQKDAAAKLYTCIQNALTKATPAPKPVVATHQDAPTAAKPETSPVSSSTPAPTSTNSEKADDAKPKIPSVATKTTATNQAPSDKSQPASTATTAIPLPPPTKQPATTIPVPQAKISLLTLDKKDTSPAKISPLTVSTESIDEK